MDMASHSTVTYDAYPKGPSPMIAFIPTVATRNYALQRTAGASWLQSMRPMRRVAELGSLGGEMKHTLILMLLATATALAAGDDAGWSMPVKGLRARLVVLPSEKADSAFCRVFIEFENVDDVVGQKKIRFTPDK